jgi:hypothetical protein
MRDDPVRNFGGNDVECPPVMKRHETSGGIVLEMGGVEMWYRLFELVRERFLVEEDVGIMVSVVEPVLHLF